MSNLKLSLFVALVAIIGIVAIVAVVGGFNNEPILPAPTPVDGCIVHVGGQPDCQHKAKCEVCGKEYGEKGDHVAITLAEVFPTCTETGLRRGSKCALCGVTIKAQETVPAKGHNLVVVPEMTPDCYSDGYSKHSACLSCDYTEGKVALNSGHNFVIDVAEYPATCDEDGYTAHKKCSRCDAIKGKEVIPAGHSFGAPDANGTRTCSACGLVEVSTSEGFKAAIEGGVANINVLAGTYLTNVKVPGGSNITIVGAGKSTVLEGQIATTSSTEGTLTLRNLVINVNDKIVDGTGISQTGKSAIAIWGNQTVVCEDVTFNMSLKDSTAITSWWDTGVGTSIVVRNSVFNANGQRPIRATGNVTVENTIFNDPYRYAIQLTGKASTANLLDKAIINFNNNTIVNGASGKSLVYGIQFEGEDYGCNDLIVNGAGNVIVAGEWDTANESAMYFCECCPKVDHDSIEWNVEVEVVHEGHTYGAPDANGNKTCSSCGATEVSSSAGVKDAIGNLESGDKVILPEGDYTLPSLSGKNGVTIEGAADGSTVIGGEGTSTGFGSNFGKDNTYKNLTFSGATNGVRWSYANGGVNTFDNCTFQGDSTYGFHMDSSNGATLIFNNCTFIGFNAFAGDLEKVVFNNCIFLHNGNYGHTNIWSVAEFNNCTWGDRTSVSTKGKLYFDGVEESYHHEFIGSAESLIDFQKSVNEGRDSWTGQKVVLVADIDLENVAWTPIGQTGATEFKGTFDGQGHTIYNLYVDNTASTDKYTSSGLFGWAERSVTIKNVNIDGATVMGNHNVAVIVGYTYGGVITNCHVSNATVICTHANDDACGDKAGAIVGYAGSDARITDCSASNSTITAGRDAGQLVGAGYNVSVSGCTADNVTVSAGGDCPDEKNINNDIIGRKLG